MQGRKPPLPALTVKLSKYNVDDVALGVCKTGAEEAGVTEVRTSLSEKKFELWREIKVGNMIKLLSRKPTALRLVNTSAAKIKIFTASALYFFFNDTATTEIYTLSLHDALPI